MKKPFGIGLVPMTSTDDVEANLKQILSKLEYYEKNNLTSKTDLICFPENSLYFNFYKNLPPEEALRPDNSAFQVLGDWARKHNTYLHMGGNPLMDNGKVYNASTLLTPEGKMEIIYRKIHLFDVDVEGRTLRESLSVNPGPEPKIIEINGCKIGLSICYDIRFAELFVHYHREQVDLILAPASFLVPTGRAHWSTLLRARAIETQSFVAAVGQVGVHKSAFQPEAADKETWGQSLIFGPWGETIASSKSFDEGGNVSDSPLWSELDPTLIQKTRTQIPLLGHRKLRF